MHPHLGAVAPVRLGAPGHNCQSVEALDRTAGTATGLLRTATGDVLSSPLVLSSAVTEAITDMGSLAFVDNSAVEFIDVDLENLELYVGGPIVNVPTLSGWGMLLLALALGVVALRLVSMRDAATA